VSETVTATVRAYLSLGSNLGDRLANLAEAIARLQTGRDGRRREETGSELVVSSVSPVYETAPIGESGSVVFDQPSYLNCAVAIDTTIDAVNLRAFTAGIERTMGRGTHGRWQPRTIDIDLVLYGSERISKPGLDVPHPRMTERAFVLKPLIDLDPEISAPGTGRLAALVAATESQGCIVHTSAPDFQALIDSRLLEPGTD
jgi:2-amino-4-hydroxy-6-hydroxymethyldihydropteridine diphosphokinase